MEFSETELAERTGRILLRNGRFLSTAESCTGGLIGSILTSVPGSSLWYRGGVIAYSNAFKTDVLGVPSSLIESNGAVSREVVLAMADGMNKLAGTDISISVSGVAGPGGGTVEKPAGTVWMAVCGWKFSFSEMKKFTGERNMVRKKAADYLLTKLYSLLEKGEN